MLALALLGAMPARAQDPFAVPLPAGAERTAERNEAVADYAMPVGRWVDGSVPTRRVEGRLVQSAWRIPDSTLPTMEMFVPIRDALTTAGYNVLFECAAEECGGFDFRYATAVIAEPHMHIALGDYRYLAAMRGDAVLSLFVSRSPLTGFVQITQVVPSGGQPSVTVAAPHVAETPARPTGPAAELDANGSVALDDLVFDSGATDLDPGTYESLRQLAAYLAAHPDRSIVLVGHTDSTGSLDANISLSQQRAASVRQRLIDRHGVAPDRITAAGVGYLAPRATNLTEEGRTKNRRVEAVMPSTR